MSAYGHTYKQAEQIFKMCDGRCFYCGEQLDEEKWQIEHVIPKSQGGVTKPHNLVPSCRRCNKVKLNRTADEFKQYMRDRIQASADNVLLLLDRMRRNLEPGDTDDLAGLCAEMSERASRLEITWHGEQEGALTQ